MSTENDILLQKSIARALFEVFNGRTICVTSMTDNIIIGLATFLSTMIDQLSKSGIIEANDELTTPQAVTWLLINHMMEFVVHTENLDARGIWYLRQTLDYIAHLKQTTRILTSMADNNVLAANSKLLCTLENISEGYDTLIKGRLNLDNLTNLINESDNNGPVTCPLQRTDITS